MRINPFEYPKSPNHVTRILLIIYLVTIVWVLLLKLGVHFSYMVERKINFIPFKEFFSSNDQIDFPGLILNVIIFVPLGIYISISYNKWSLIKKFIPILVISLCIEILQYALKIGAFDLTDVVTNTSGGMLGLFIYKVIIKIVHHETKAQKLVNMIAIIGTVVIVSLLILLKLDLLPIHYR